MFPFIDFILFGEGSGDTVGPRDDDGVTGSIRLNTAIVYFGKQQHIFYVRHARETA